MSDDLDPRLAELLRRGPPAPPALDDAHRQAVLREARQAWFLAQARRRRNTLATAAAACLVAGVAGWSLRVVAEPAMPGASTMAEAQAVSMSQPVLAPPDPPAEATAFSDGAHADDSHLAASSPATQQRPAAAPPAPSGPAPMAAALVADAAPATPDGTIGGVQTTLGEQAAPQAFFGVAGNGTAAEGGQHKVVATPAASGEAVPVAAKRMRSENAQSQPDGRIVLSRLVLAAEREGRLAGADRAAALRTAHDQLAGLDQPEANAMREQLAALLRAP